MKERMVAATIEADRRNGDKPHTPIKPLDLER
jgi:hypothetical protein